MLSATFKNEGLTIKVKDWGTLVIGDWCMMGSLVLSLQNTKEALNVAQ